MSKIDEAYSLEYQDIIDAEKAYELFGYGVIKSKKGFQCSDPNCSAQITCANIDKERTDMKKKPYFKCYGIHSNLCKVDKYFERKEINIFSKDKSNDLRYLNNHTDKLLFNIPESDNIILKSNKIVDCEQHKKNKQQLKDELDKGGTRNSQYSTLEPIVVKYKKYKELGVLKEHYIEIKGYKISYEDMFVNINQVKFEDRSKYNRIYYGQGKIRKKKNNNNEYFIRFEEKFKDSTMDIIVNIKKELVETYYRKNKLMSELNNLVTLDDKIIIFYVYTNPRDYRETAYMNINKMNLFYYEVL